MADSLPKYDRPPVVETVLSAQFTRLQKYRTAHAGYFWKSLDTDWASIEEGVKIIDAFERFGDERKWGPMGAFQLTTALEPQRTQIIRSDGTRMIQIQDSRFLYNWQKKEGTPDYPSYQKTRSEFDGFYDQFKEFAKSSQIGEIEENQWEVVYVNHLFKGDQWNSPQDWVSIFPWLKFPQELFEPEAIISGWDSILPDNLGRLHTNLNLGRTSMMGPEALILQLTARGPVSPHAVKSAAEGFEIGHSAIVRSFTAMTSGMAHEYWGRTA